MVGKSKLNYLEDNGKGGRGGRERAVKEQEGKQGRCRERKGEGRVKGEEKGEEKMREGKGEGKRRVRGR